MENKKNLDELLGFDPSKLAVFEAKENDFYDTRPLVSYKVTLTDNVCKNPDGTPEYSDWNIYLRVYKSSEHYCVDCQYDNDSGGMMLFDIKTSNTSLKDIFNPLVRILNRLVDDLGKWVEDSNGEYILCRKDTIYTFFNILTFEAERIGKRKGNKIVTHWDII